MTMERRDAVISDLKRALLDCICALDRPQTQMEMRMTLLQVGEVLEVQVASLREKLMQKKVS